MHQAVTLVNLHRLVRGLICVALIYRRRPGIGMRHGKRMNQVECEWMQFGLSGLDYNPFTFGEVRVVVHVRT